MKIPKRLQPLVDSGLVDSVVRPLMSGKEADLYVVESGGELRCAKVYKDAMKRSFKKAVLYREGRKVRNSRRGRAMERGSRYGKQQQEDVWQTTEVDALYRLDAAGVPVPKPHMCLDGVLLMELVTGADGDVAPRLGEVAHTRDEALNGHATMLGHVVSMLLEGLVHGDLSEFNILLGTGGPVVIDLPQVVDAAANNQAGWMLVRDVNALTRWYGKWAPDLLGSHYGEEIWQHYEAGSLTAETRLSGTIALADLPPDVDGVLADIRAVLAEEEARLAALRAPDPDQAVED